MGHRPRKRFGQHFLRDQSILQQIVHAVSPKQDDQMVEIGAGLGALTKKLLPHLDKLSVIEIDRDILPLLMKACSNFNNLDAHLGDALKFDYTELVNKKHSLRVVGNLPYNISTPLLFHLLEQSDVIKDMHFLLQKEVAERMAAEPGSKLYGRLGIMVQYHCQVDLLFPVSHEAFDPPPRVESAFVRLVPYTKNPFPCEEVTLLEEIVRTAFSHRRKTLHNCLKGLFTDADLLELKISPKLRPEDVSIADYVLLSNTLSKKNRL